MHVLKSTRIIKQVGLFFALFNMSHSTFSQQVDSTKATPHVSDAITVTNNDISVIPTFILSKPATVCDLVVSKKRLTFEPQFRFARDCDCYQSRCAQKQS